MSVTSAQFRHHASCKHMDQWPQSSLCTSDLTYLAQQTTSNQLHNRSIVPAAWLLVPLIAHPMQQLATHLQVVEVEEGGSSCCLKA
jgi:hypothetical protein